MFGHNLVEGLAQPVSEKMRRKFVADKKVSRAGPELTRIGLAIHRCTFALGLSN